MKFLIIICLVASSSAFQKSSEENSSEEKYDYHQSCGGIEDVDLSDLSLHLSDLQKIISKDEGDEGRNIALYNGEQLSMEDIKTSLTDNGMAVIRNVIIPPSRQKSYAKIMQTSKAQGDFLTSVAGSLNSSVISKTGGKVIFNVAISTYDSKSTPGQTISGEATVATNSSMKWVKKKVKMLETKTTTDTTSTMSWGSEKSKGTPPSTITTKASSTSTVDTVILSKKCIASNLETTFHSDTNVQGWRSNIAGKGKGGIYSHIVFATVNGTSVAWTFAKLTMTAKSKMEAGNWSIDGSHYVTVKSFTETIIRPMSPNALNPEKDLEMSNEIKLRVGTKSKYSDGTKAYATAGQMVFRKTFIKFPPGGATENRVSAELEEDADEEWANTMLEQIVYQQTEANEALLNSGFVSGVISSTFN